MKGYVVNNLSLVLVVSSFALGIYGGWYFTYNHYVSKERKTQEAIIEALATQAEINRKVAEDLAVNVSVLRDAYIKLGRKSREVKIINADCSITSDGISLWNESLLGKEVLPGSTDTINGAGRGSASFADAFQNKLLNDERCAVNREKINSMKKWCIETFGEERCSH